MADETQNPYEYRKPKEGPFNEYLDPTATPNVQSEPHQSPQRFSGMEGATGKVLGIASKFLEGLGRGRMVKALSDEKAKTDKVQRYMAWGQSILNDPNITDEAREQFKSEWTKGLLTETAGAVKQSEKHHPLIGAVGKVIEGLSGGQVKPSKYDLKAMDEVMTKYADITVNPAFSHQGQATGVIGQVNNIIDGTLKKAKEDGKTVTKDMIDSAIPGELRTQADKYRVNINKYIEERTKAYASPTAPQQPKQLTPAEQAQKDAADKLAASRKNQPQPPPPPGTQVPVPGQSVDTPLRQKMGAQPPQTMEQPQPPPPSTPKLSPEERDYASAYKLMTKPKEVKVDGKVRQVSYVAGGNGIQSGFVDPDSGEYISNNRISEVRPEKNQPQTSYKVAVDSKGKYGATGSRFFADAKTGKPLKDPDGDVVRPPESATSTIQTRIRSELAGQMAKFKQQNDVLDKEQEQRVSALETRKVQDANSPTPRNLNSNEKEAEKKKIYDNIKKRKQQNKTETDMLMRTTAGMYGMPVQPFMTEEEHEEMNSGDQLPEGLGTTKDWDFDDLVDK